MDTTRLLSDAFLRDHPAQAARVLEGMDPSAAGRLLVELGGEPASPILQAMELGGASAILGAVAPNEAAALLASLSLDNAAALLRRVAADVVEGSLKAMDPERAESIRHRVRLAEKTAGAVADTGVLALPEDATVKDAQRRLRMSVQPYLYVSERETNRLVGVIDRPELWAAHPWTPLGEIMERDVIKLPEEMSLDTVAAHLGWRDYEILPVVDDGGRYLGALTHRVLRRQAETHPAAKPVEAALSLVMRVGELYVAGVAAAVTSLARNPVRPPSPPSSE